MFVQNHTFHKPQTLQTFVLLANVAKGSRANLLVAMEMGVLEIATELCYCVPPLVWWGGGGGGTMVQMPYTISLSTVTPNLT